MDDLAIVILAGGESSRLPGKLEADAGGLPLVLRVYENLRSAGSVYVSAKGSFSPEIDARLDCPIIIDRWPGRGPLGGLYSVFCAVRERRVFVAAGDAPFVNTSAVEAMHAQWEDGLEAVVAQDPQGRLEPLCALYDRTAFLREAFAVLAKSGAVKDAVERLRFKRIALDSRLLANVNTPADRRAYIGA